MSHEAYLALVGAEARVSLQAPMEHAISEGGFRAHSLADDLRLFTTATLSVRKGRGCVVVGGVFGETSLVDVPGVTPDDLVERCRGNYLAFGISDAAHVQWILRSPLGHLPALHSEMAGTKFLSSHTDLLLDASGRTAQVDWTFVREHLAFRHLQTSRTGLEGIDELLGGECLERAADGAWERRAVWTPWTWTMPEREIDDPQAAGQALRTSVAQVVQNLVNDTGPVLLELSGGLDSSILAASLAAARADAQAVTLLTDGAEADERDYARMTARATNLPLHELAINAVSDLSPSATLRVPRPGLPVILGPADRVLARLAVAQGASAFVSGAGGDCVFCTPASAAPAADAICRFGLGRTAWHAIDALSRIHNANVWSVGTMAWEQARRGPLDKVWPKTPGLMLPSQVPMTVPAHPWFHETAGVLPGKRSHVRSILASLAHVDGYGRHAIAPSRFPLLSQPVIETALRIPSWLWIANGQDRAVARRAWSGFLPAPILDRRTKGGLDGYAIEAIERLRPQLMTLLLDGHLARANIIDRPRIEAVLNARAQRDEDGPHLLLPLIDMECWLRTWHGET